MSVLSEKRSVAGCSTQKNNQVLQGFKYMATSSVKVHSNICKLQIQIILHMCTYHQGLCSPFIHSLVSNATDPMILLADSEGPDQTEDVQADLASMSTNARRHVFTWHGPYGHNMPEQTG